MALLQILNQTHSSWLNEEIVCEISRRKGEPEWLKESGA